MTTIKEHLNQAGIRLAPGKLELVHGQLSKITRSPNLVPQPGRKHENVLTHTLSMLGENQRVFQTYESVARELDYLSAMAGIFEHDISEGFTPYGDLNYANAAHTDLRRAKELEEHSTSHHFVEHNILGRESKKRFHSFIDEWAILDSPLSLYVRLHDMGDGNKSVIRKAMDLHNGVIRKLDSQGNAQVWPILEVESHISNIASNKTFPVVEKLIHKLIRKETSLAILHWFDKGMMKTYADAGWGYLPVIQEMQTFLDTELKGFEI